MDQMQAYQKYLESFGIPVYDDSTVPNNASFPRITYLGQMGEFDEVIYNDLSLWYKSTSWKDVTQKAIEIYESIGLGGTVIPYDGGALWIKRGTPFMRRMSDPDTLIRRMFINIEVEFFSNL